MFVSMRVVGRVVASLCQAIFLVILARVIGPSSFGSFGVFYSAVGVAWVLAGFGVSSRVLLLQAGDNSTEQNSRLAWLKLVSTAVVACIAALSVMVVEGDRLWAMAGAALAILDSLIDYLQAYYAAIGDQPRSILVFSSPRIVLLVAVIAVQSTASSILPAVMSSILVMTVVAVVMIARMLRRLSGLIQEARSSLGFWASSALGNLRNLEPSVLAATADKIIGGQFALVSRVGNALLIVTASLQSVFVPRLAATLQDPQEFRAEFRKVERWCLSYGALLALVSPVAGRALELLLGSEYSGSGRIAFGIVLAAGFQAISNCYLISFYARGRAGVVAWIAGLSNGLEVVGLGAVALALGSGWVFLVPPIAQAMQAILMAFWHRRTS
jgi:O-antigen/teichoic acid export membrane protein